MGDLAGETIGRRATRGSLSLVFGQACTRLALTTGLLLLASLLTPAQFGVVAIATLCVAATNAVLAVGVGSAILVLDGGQELDRTALTTAIAIGAGACAAVILVAPALAQLIGDPDATPFLRALAPTLLFARWSEVRRAMLERELRFAQATTIEALSAIAGVVTAIIAASAGAGAWALVYQQLVAQGLMALGFSLHRAGSRRPGYSPVELGRLWGYGRHLLMNSILLFAYSNLDNAAVARVAGTSALGLYAFAFSVTNAPVYLLTHTVNRVMLPVYASLRANGQEWGLVYSRMLRVVAALTGTIMFGLLIHGPRVLTEIYGSRWEASYGALQVLCIYGLSRSVGATTGAVFLASGQPQLVSVIARWQTLAMLVIIVPALMAFGIVGGAVAVTVPLVFAAAYAVRRSSLIVGVAPGSLARSLTTIWGAAAVANLVGVPITGTLSGWAGLSAAGVAVLVTAATFGYFLLRADVAPLVRHLRRQHTLAGT